MGCASSRPMHHNHQRGRQHHSPHEQPQMSYYDAPRDSKRSGMNNAFVPEPLKPPPPVAPPHVTNRYAPSASYNPYDSPYSQRNYAINGKPRAHTRARYVPQQNLQQKMSREVSPPRHRSEMPRRNASHQYRDVSPLGSSRFERPFERAHVAGGQGRATTVGATFRDGGIGGWENW